MSVTLTPCRVLVLVKALPHPSRRYGETVCCAGLTPAGEWKRLFPIRFRHLRENRFKRWQWLDFGYRRPTSDGRTESCHVMEDTLQPGPMLPRRDRARLLEPALVGSVRGAQEAGRSLALVRPEGTRFSWRAKSTAEIEAERQANERAVSQKDLLDGDDLKAIEPLPYRFRLSFRDADGKHDHACEDWETSATFWKWRKVYGEEHALQRLSGRYNDEYPRKGMVLALGNMKARPRTWLLLGIIRLDPREQLELPL